MMIVSAPSSLPRYLPACARWRWWVYRLLLHPLLVSLLWLGALAVPKLRAVWQQRRVAEQVLPSILAKRDNNKPLVWFHVASAGEFLQGLPIMERVLGSNVQCVLSFASPSTKYWVKRTQVEHPQWLASYPLPLDNYRSVQKLLEQLKPSALVFVKYDLWPNLVWQARLKGIPSYLLGATLHRSSGRLSWLARGWFRCLLESTDYIVAASQGDAQLLKQICPRHGEIQVLGDSRFDSVIKRVQADPPPIPLGISQARQVLVAGSTWPSDEKVLLPVIKQALKQFPQFAVLLAPHEPTPVVIKRLTKAFKEFGSILLSQVPANHRAVSRVLLVDKVGILATSYKLGTMAYVGGGHTTGVHSVLEPAAAALPVCFGSFYQNSPEACTMISKKLAFCTPNTQTFKRQLFDWLESPQIASEIGKKAYQFVVQQAGASDAYSRLIIQTI